MDLGLKDSAVLVTGGNRGIGLVIARAFADEGASVAICGRDRAALESAQASLADRGPEDLLRPTDGVVVEVQPLEHPTHELRPIEFLSLVDDETATSHDPALSDEEHLHGRFEFIVVDPDDIALVVALPNGTIGVLWSDQATQRFGFRYHVDTYAPNVGWAEDEIPASISAVDVSREATASKAPCTAP